MTKFGRNVAEVLLISVTEENLLYKEKSYKTLAKIIVVAISRLR